MKKILICGSREFNDYHAFKLSMDEYLSSADTSKIEIVSGGARGADTFARQYAQERSIVFTEFKADWNQFGRAAGYVRNSQMAEYCAGVTNTCIAYWDGKSLGTKHMMHEALKKRMSVVKRLVNIKKEGDNHGNNCL